MAVTDHEIKRMLSLQHAAEDFTRVDIHFKLHTIGLVGVLAPTEQKLT